MMFLSSVMILDDSGIFCEKNIYNSSHTQFDHPNLPYYRLSLLTSH